MRLREQAASIAVRFIPMKTFSRNANGVRAINCSTASAPTPLALGLNVETSHLWPLEVSLCRNQMPHGACSLSR